jgi:hypothetical protein
MGAVKRASRASSFDQAAQGGEARVPDDAPYTVDPPNLRPGALTGACADQSVAARPSPAGSAALAARAAG